LSAKASQTAQISSSADNLTRAAVLYDQAADLFEKVKKETSDAGVSDVLIDTFLLDLLTMFG
jgi:hypothetical protein